MCLHITACCFGREHSCEVLFELDDDERSVAAIILDSLLQVSVGAVTSCVVNNQVATSGAPVLAPCSQMADLRQMGHSKG